jgi:hypothetical protein
LAQKFGYPYEEFADHLKAMRTVRQWEDTSRFGHLGDDQTNRAHIARALEYFSDSYETQAEAIQKAEMFLMICDYLARHNEEFTSQNLSEKTEGDRLLVDAALLRAVHHVFTVLNQPSSVEPRKVLALALAFNQVEQSIGSKLTV